MTKPIHYILLALAIIAILLLVIYWPQVRDFFSSSDQIQSDYDICINKHKLLPDGSDCTFCREPANRYAKGVIKDGACVIADQATISNNNSSSNSLQVSNPNGAIMYYQSDLASGGKLYSASNVVVPYGTKFNLVNTWQTNLSTQPFSGYYETTFKQYGASSGFFDVRDIIKL